MNNDRASSQMLSDIEYETHYCRRLIGKDKLDERVLAAMKAVPRHCFVPADQQYRAYANGALAIGHGQTISQPFIVALMTDLLAPTAGDTVLEVGTGSGYQSAILARLVKQVHTLERIADLAAQAHQRLQHQAITNVEVHVANGYQGWPEQAPYDGIIVTAAAPFVPQALLDQLKPGGRLVIPIGQAYFSQELMVVEKLADSGIKTTSIMGVVFVPLVDNDEKV